MRSILILALFTPSLLLVAPGPFETVPVRTAAAEGASDPGLLAADPPPAPRRYYGAIWNIGWVVAIDANSLTIRERGYGPGPGPHPGGNTIKFPVCPELVAGEVLALEGDLYPPYPFADVRAGDLIGIHAASRDMVYEINIFRRPGGRLAPPSVAPRGKKVKYNVELGLFAGAHPYHEWINAFQDYEERGIPLPPKMRPQYGSRGIPGDAILHPDGTITPEPGAEPPKQRVTLPTQQVPPEGAKPAAPASVPPS